MSKVLPFASRLSKLSIVIGAIMFIWLIGVSVSLYHQRQTIMAERERVHDAVTSTSCKKVPDTRVRALRVTDHYNTAKI